MAERYRYRTSKPVVPRYKIQVKPANKPRFNLAEQVKVLGADSLLPPESTRGIKQPDKHDHYTGPEVPPASTYPIDMDEHGWPIMPEILKRK